MSECNTCNDRKLVGGFLPQWCPVCHPSDDIETAKFDQALVDLLTANVAALTEDLAKWKGIAETLRKERDEMTAIYNATFEAGEYEVRPAIDKVRAIIQQRDAASNDRERIRGLLSAAIDERDSARAEAEKMRTIIGLLIDDARCYCSALPAQIGGKCDYCTAQDAISTAHAQDEREGKGE